MSRADFEELLSPDNGIPCDEVIQKLQNIILKEGLPDSEGVFSFVSVHLMFF
jgi:hypothetical protein